MKILAETVDGEILEVEVEVHSDKEIANVKLKDDWSVAGDHLIYLPETYMQHAQEFLNKKPSDLKQGAEKIWGLMAHIIKEFYLKICVDIKSHRALRALAMFMFDFTDSKSSTRLMTNCFRDAETCHKNFYAEGFMKKDLVKILDKMQDFMSAVAKISNNEVKKSLDQYICGKISTESDLEGIVFREVDYVEKIGGKDYVVNVVAK